MPTLRRTGLMILATVLAVSGGVSSLAFSEPIPTSGDYSLQSFTVAPREAEPVYSDGQSSWVGTLRVTDEAQGTGHASSVNVEVSHPSMEVSAAIDNDDGTYTVYITASLAGLYTVSASLEGATTSTSIEREIVFRQPTTGMYQFALRSFAVAPDSAEPVAPDGVASWRGTVSLTTADYTRLAVGYAHEVVVEASDPAVTVGEVVDLGNGDYTVALTSTKAGTFTITASLDYPYVHYPRTQKVTFSDRDPLTDDLMLVAFSALPEYGGMVYAGWGDAWLGRIHLDDGRGAVSSGYAFAISVTSDDPAVSISSPVDEGDGTYTVRITADRPGDYLLTARVGDHVIQQYVGFADIVIACDPYIYMTGLGVAPDSSGAILADGISSWTISAGMEYWGQPDRFATGLTDPVSISVADPAVSVGPLTDRGSGNYSATITSTQAGVFTVSVVDNMNGCWESVVTRQVWFGPADGSDSGVRLTGFEVSPLKSQPVYALGNWGWLGTLSFEEITQNPAGKPYLVNVAASSEAVQVHMAEDQGNGTYTVHVTSTQSGTFTLTARHGDQVIDQQVTFAEPVAVALRTMRSHHEVSDRNFAGVSGEILTITLVDTQDRTIQVPGKSDLIQLGYDNDKVQASTLVDHGDGTYSTKVTATEEGWYTISIIVGESTWNTTVIFYPAPDPLIAFGGTTVACEKEKPLANGQDQCVATVTILDLSDPSNPATGFADQIVVDIPYADSPVHYTAPVDQGDGTYTFILTATEPASTWVDVTIIGGSGTFGANTTTFYPVPPEPEFWLEDVYISPSGGEPIYTNSSVGWGGSVTIRDFLGGGFRGYNDSITITASDPAVTISELNDIKMFNVYSTKAGTFTITVAVDNGIEVQTMTRQVRFVDRPAPPAPVLILANVDIRSDSSSVTANDLDDYTATITLVDTARLRTPATGFGDVMEITASDPSVTVSSLTDNDDGTYTVHLTSDTPGTFELRTTVNGKTLQRAMTFDEVVTPPVEPEVVLVDFTVNPVVTSEHPTFAYVDEYMGTVILGFEGNPEPGAVASGFGDAFEVSVDTEKVNISDVVDNNDGTYTIRFTAKTSVVVGGNFDAVATVALAESRRVHSIDRTMYFSATHADYNYVYFMGFDLTSDSGHPLADGKQTWVGTFRLDATMTPSYGLASVVEMTVSDPAVEPSEIVDHGDGTYTVEFTSTEPGQFTVTLSIPNDPWMGPPSEVSRTMEFWPIPECDPAYWLEGFTVAPTHGGPVYANDESSWTGTVRLGSPAGDGSGNSGGIQVTASDPQVRSTAVVDQGDGTYTFELTSPIVGNFLITVTVGSDLCGFTSRTQYVTFLTMPPVQLSWTMEFEVEPLANTEPNGRPAWTGTVTVSDGMGVGVAGMAHEIVLSSTEPAVTFSDITDVGDGTYTFTMASVVAGKPTVRAMMLDVDGNPVVVARVIEFTARGDCFGPQTPYSMTIGRDVNTPYSETVVADGLSAWVGTIVMTNENDTPQLDDIEVSDPRLLMSAPVDQGSGIYHVRFTTLTAGEYTVSVPESDECGTIITREFVLTFAEMVPTVSVSQSSVSVSSTIPWVGDTVDVTATVKDSQGRAMESVEVEFHVSGFGTLSAPQCTSNAQGVCQVSLSSTKAGPNSVTVLINSEEITGSGVEVTFFDRSIPRYEPQVSITHSSRVVGETQVVNGSGFEPGEEVRLVVTSNPWVVGTQTASGQGTVSFAFSIPASLDPGVHTATLSSQQWGEASRTFEVQAAPSGGGTTAPPGGGTTSPPPTTVTPPAAPSAVAPTGGLISSPVTVWIAVMMVAGGLAVASLSRLRRHTS